ncbi:DMSO/selenate family reductase complex A subunit [Vibrio metschnikovii]|uniref:DMSO/selenate family reductase complex A subunit n=1 Tax=Vibrio metschnikovii TaxID=28172 RepID=UPI001C311572|nr:DMSO/selenate family reductase complex A subunit [Vibrio metschnikovii]
MSTSIIKKLFTRREFIQSSAVASGAAIAASSISLPFNALAAPTPSSSLSPEQIRYSACLVNCGSRCPFKVHVRDGVAVKISPEDGVNEAIFGQHQIRPCLRGRSARFRTYNPDRLKYPMKRVGERGEGKFKRISWDEATTIVAEQLQRVINTYGNEAIYYQYGSGTTGANLQGRNTCKRLLNLAGGFLDMHNTYSEAQLNRIQPFVFGQAGNIYGTEQQTLFAEIKNSDLVVMFGQNLAETRMSGGGQIAEIYHALEQSGAKVILIDPRRTDSVTAFNAEWLPIRPGTDAALVAAIGHTLIKENLLDEAMLNQYTVGWSEETLPASAPANSSYKAYILGLGEDKIEKTPEWAEALTEIPAQRIRQLAREIASAKAAWISQGWGVQRTQNGEHAARAIMMLPIMTGHFGRPGTNIGTWGGSVNYPLAGLAIPNPVKVSIPCFSWVDAITRGTEMTPEKDYIKGRDRLTTNVKFLWNYASNITANQHSDLNQVDKVLRDESLCEFILVWDNHMTASAKYADLLLPDVSTLESDELINNSYQSGSYHYLVRLQKAIEPMWENRPTYDVLAEIADKMGLKEAFTEGRTYQEWIEHAYNQVRKQEPHLPPFEQTDGMGVIDRRIADSSKHIALKDFRDDPKQHPLKTPSGKIEIYSEQLAELATQWQLLPGDKISAIPEYWPAVEGIEDKPMLNKYPLQLTGFHTKGHCHSTYSSVAQLKEVAPDVLWINPIDAQVRGIHNDDFVEVFNDRGRVRIKAKVSPRIMPGVTAMPEGAWAQTNKQGVDVGGCINRLTSLRPTALAKGNPQHTNLVDVKRV